MEKIKLIKIMADSFYEFGKELYYSGNEDISSIFTCFAFGFYRDVEDVRGMQICNEHLKKENKKNPIKFSVIQKIGSNLFSKISDLDLSLPDEDKYFLIKYSLGSIMRKGTYNILGGI